MSSGWRWADGLRKSLALICLVLLWCSWVFCTTPQAFDPNTYFCRFTISYEETFLCNWKFLISPWKRISHFNFRNRCSLKLMYVYMKTFHRVSWEVNFSFTSAAGGASCYLLLEVRSKIQSRINFATVHCIPLLLRIKEEDLLRKLNILFTVVPLVYLSLKMWSE